MYLHRCDVEGAWMASWRMEVEGGVESHPSELLLAVLSKCLDMIWPETVPWHIVSDNAIAQLCASEVGAMCSLVAARMLLFQRQLFNAARTIAEVDTVIAQRKSANPV
eukprot:4044550-Amphidinium_carterae.1